MSFWKKFKKVGKWVGRGLSVLPYIFQAMELIEALSDSKGAAKREKAIDLASYLMSVAEDTAGRDLLDDEEVKKALEAVMDAYVAFQNIVAKKS